MIASVSVTDPSAKMPMPVPPPELAAVGAPIVLPWIVPVSVPVMPSSSIPIASPTGFWMVLPLTVILVWSRRRG